MKHLDAWDVGAVVILFFVLALVILAVPARAPEVEPIPPTTMDKMIAILRSMPAADECREEGRIICCFGNDGETRCCNQNAVGDCLRAQVR